MHERAFNEERACWSWDEILEAGRRCRMYQNGTAWYLAAAKLRDIQIRDPPPFAVFHPTANRFFDRTLPKPGQDALSLIKLHKTRSRNPSHAIFLHATRAIKRK
jgi:hypothetical protein